MCSRNSPAASFRSNSSSEMNQYSRPFSSPSRRGRVVAEIASSSSGMRASSSRSIVPLPAPDVPVTTKTGLGGMPRTLLVGRLVGIPLCRRVVLLTPATRESRRTP
jgi:hypothetical protein